MRGPAPRATFVGMRPLLALLSLSACTPALRAVTKEDFPRRWALAAAEPAQLHRVLGVDLSVHDSDPSSAKPVLVCLHAIAHGGGDFAGVEAQFAASWRIITLDWPGHGRSGPDIEPASAARYAQLFEALVTQLQLTRFVLLGNSIGGAVAIRHAAAHPEQVRALVLANPGGLDPGGLLARFFIGTLVDHFEQGERNETRFEPWFRRYYDDILVTDAARTQRERIVAAGYEHATVLAQAWRSFAAPEANLASFIPRVTMPVLFTWAKRDGLISWGRNRAAVESFAHATVEFFEAGHAPFLETPETFQSSLARFLAGLER
jgi:pimeloyl-ACP methyl ester carboxylesterase